MFRLPPGQSGYYKAISDGVVSRIVNARSGTLILGKCKNLTSEKKKWGKKKEETPQKTGKHWLLIPGGSKRGRLWGSLELFL